VSEFRFASPIAFLLFIPLAITLFFWYRGQLRRASAMMSYSDTRLLGGLPRSIRSRLRRLPDVLNGVAWIILICALARPQVGAVSATFVHSGVDMVIALDISGSMATPDFTGISRLEASKAVMSQFIDQRTTDRMGLVVFAEDAFYLTPLTFDHAVLQQQLSRVTLAPDAQLSNRTALGVGMGSATNLLRESDANSKVIILVTDGASNAGVVDPSTAAFAARAFGVKVYAIGIGTTTVSVEDMALDEGMLREIADITEGRYFQAMSLDDLTSIYESINQLEQSARIKSRRVTWAEQAQIWIGMALALLILARVSKATIFQTIP